jgi:hypothetical protein
MAVEKFESDIPGKFSPEEEAVLDYLYNHPDEAIVTKSLTEVLKPDRDTEEKQHQSYEEIQGAIEALIVSGLVKGKRGSSSGKIFFSKLRLTPKGEIAAINERKRPKKIVVKISDVQT